MFNSSKAPKSAIATRAINRTNKAKYNRLKYDGLLMATAGGYGKQYKHDSNGDLIFIK